MICAACTEEISTDFENDYQGDNNLWLGLFGGYGMFIESKDYTSDNNLKVLEGTGSTYEVNLCHECAHKLCQENPWLEKIINTHNAHSHTAEYWEKHPDHYGWDKK